MEFLGLHIHHLDDGEEADKIIQMLRLSGVDGRWSIKRPTDETNSIIIPVNISNTFAEDWRTRQQKINESIKLLQVLNKKTIDIIKELGLNVAMRVHTKETYIPFSEEFVKECGRLGLEICVLNTRY